MTRTSLLAVPVLAIGLGALGLSACGYGPEPEPRNKRPAALEFRFSGQVIEKRGRCHTIRSFRRGRLYSVRAGALGDIPKGAAIRVEGRLGSRLGCPYPRLVLEDIRKI